MPDFLNSRNNENLGFEFSDKGEICFVWLCGFHSVFSGSKAGKMAQVANELGASSLRFDYSGNGISGGDFDKGTISKWRDDALEIISKFAAKKKLILVGSSMGGWISILLLRQLKNVKALCLIAPAPDFTEDLMWAKFDDAARKEILDQGFWLRDSEYSPEPYKITRELIEDGRENLVLRENIEFDGPVQIFHGMNDEDVPFERSIRLAQAFTTDDVTLTYVKDGNHRLSRDSDLDLLGEILRRLFFQMQTEN